MTIYQIDEKIADLLSAVDPETGELLADFEAVEALQMERDAKVENLALAYKNLTAEAKAIKAEVDSLSKRQKVAENEAKRIKEYLAFVLNGEKFKSPRVAVSYTRTKSVEPDDSFVEWAMQNGEEYLRYKDPEADKTAIKAALENGAEIPHVKLVEKVGVTVR